MPGRLKAACTGGKGRKPGNDHELLGTRHSLSVDEASDDPSSCWNLLPHGMSGPEGGGDDRVPEQVPHRRRVYADAYA